MEVERSHTQTLLFDYLGPGGEKLIRVTEPKVVSLLGSFIMSKDNFHTRKSYFMDITHFLEFLKYKKSSLNLFDVKRRDVDHFKEYLSRYGPIGKNKASSKKTINRKINAISSFYTYLCRTDIILVNPCRYVERYKVSKQVTTNIFNREVFREILNYFDRGTPRGRLNYAIFLILGATGMRIGELVGLNVESYHKRGEEGTLSFVIQKSNKNAIKHLNHKMMEAIEDHLLDRADTGGSAPLFCGAFSIDKTGEDLKRLDRSSVYRTLRSTLKNLGYENSKDFCIHSFRAFFITEALDKFSIRDIQVEVGHSNLNQTAEYDKAKRNNSLGAANFIMEDGDA